MGPAALWLILRATIDRHRELQIVLGHGGEMLWLSLDRLAAAIRDFLGTLWIIPWGSRSIMPTLRVIIS